MIEVQGQSAFVQANGLRHHVLRYGHADRPILILPGITSPAATADFIAAKLAHQYRVYVPDLRGRGRSEVGAPGGYTLDNYTADVAGLVETLGLDRPTILGHSMGARIAAAYCTSTRHARGPVVLVDPPLSGPGRGPYPTSLDSFMTQLSEARRGTTPEEVRRFYPKWPDREIAIRIEALASCDEVAIRESHRGLEQEDFFPYWAQLDPPAVLVRGEDSPVVTEEGVAQLSGTNPRIPIVTVPQAGHMVAWDNFDGFITVLAQFLYDADLS
ncbi:MAG: alpha/beta fold hydrolase [Pseudonocardiaceae bacterium]|nr:alpha/beta fold hydrolase [Pseudonocardiaceae bacterium]